MQAMQAGRAWAEGYGGGVYGDTWAEDLRGDLAWAYPRGRPGGGTQKAVRVAGRGKAHLWGRKPGPCCLLTHHLSHSPPGGFPDPAPRHSGHGG